MNVKILAETQEANAVLGEALTPEKADIDTAKRLSGYCAAFCYMSGDFNKIVEQGEEKALKRLDMCRRSGHHSVMDHMWFTLRIEDCPKILAMVLNNEKLYATSEKSGRYTVMKTEGREEELYHKWIDIYQKKINEVYPDLDADAIANGIKTLPSRKLAQENARCLISVFTPATTMAYSVSWRQIQYIMNWIDKFQDSFEKTSFTEKLNEVLREFYNKLSELGFEPLDDGKDRTISLLAKRERKEEYGENYCTNYTATFPIFAQALRHRTLAYEMLIPTENMEFYIPEIIRDDEKLKAEWIQDISSLSDRFPQGGLVFVNERGTLEDFILKCKERLCGHAQLEIAKITSETVSKYYEGTKDNEYIHSLIGKYVGKARCQAGYRCSDPCFWGGSKALTRKI